MVKSIVFVNSVLILVGVCTSFPVSIEENAFENEQQLKEESDQIPVTAGYDSRLSNKFQENQDSDIKNSIDEGNKHLEELFQTVKETTEVYNDDSVDDNNDDDNNDDSYDNIRTTEDDFVDDDDDNESDQSVKHVNHLFGKEDILDDDSEQESEDEDDDKHGQVDNEDSEEIDSENNFQLDVVDYIKNLDQTWRNQNISDDDSGQDSEDEDNKYDQSNFDQHDDESSEEGDVISSLQQKVVDYINNLDQTWGNQNISDDHDEDVDYDNYDYNKNKFDFNKYIIDYIKHFEETEGKEDISDESGQDSEDEDNEKYGQSDFDKDSDEINSIRNFISSLQHNIVDYNKNLDQTWGKQHTSDDDETVDDDDYDYNENEYDFNEDSSSNDQKLLLLKEIHDSLDELLFFFKSDKQNNGVPINELTKTKHNRPITITISRNNK